MISYLAGTVIIDFLVLSTFQFVIHVNFQTNVYTVSYNKCKTYTPWSFYMHIKRTTLFLLLVCKILLHVMQSIRTFYSFKYLYNQKFDYSTFHNSLLFQAPLKLSIHKFFGESYVTFTNMILWNNFHRNPSHTSRPNYWTQMEWPIWTITELIFLRNAEKRTSTRWIILVQYLVSHFNSTCDIHMVTCYKHIW